MTQIAPQVPFGIVRTIGPDGEESVLIGHGNDAESSIQRRNEPGSAKSRGWFKVVRIVDHPSEK